MTGQIPEADQAEQDQPESVDTSAELSTESQQPETPKEQPLTAEQYREIARQEAMRIAQSQVAKGEHRIQQYIQQQVAALKQAQPYTGMSDQQVQDAAQKIAIDALTNPNLPEFGQTQQPPYLQEPVMHPTIDAAIQMMRSNGTIVEEGDPEFQTIAPILASGDFSRLIEVTNAAMKAKTLRLQSRKEKATVRTPSGAPGNPTDVNDISQINDSEQLYELGDRRMRKR